MVQPMLQETKFETDIDKLERLVHYICHSRRDNPRRLSKTKLHKILFYSELQAYLAHNRPIAGEVYIKHQFGPTSTHLGDVIKALEAKNHLVVTDEPYTVGDEERSHNIYFSASEPDLSDFSTKEIEIVDHFVDRISKMSSRRISNMSHDIVWHSSEMFKPIPYYSAFLYTCGEVREEDLGWAQERLSALQTNEG